MGDEVLNQVECQLNAKMLDPKKGVNKLFKNVPCKGRIQNFLQGGGRGQHFQGGRERGIHAMFPLSCARSAIFKAKKTSGMDNYIIIDKLSE